MTPSRLSPPATNPAGYHLTHPIRPPTLTMCERGASFTDPTIPPAHVHMTTTTPPYMRPATGKITHADTIRLSAPTATIPPVALYLNDHIIDQTLQILHQHSP